MNSYIFEWWHIPIGIALLLISIWISDKARKKGWYDED